MQTFLPFSDYKESAKCLDMRRLGKERVEVLQILQCLAGIKTGWKNHPSVHQWKGFEVSLAQYGWHICNEWLNRGFKDTCKHKILSLIGEKNIIKDCIHPDWLGNEKFHSSHRAALLSKDFLYYSKFGWTEKPMINYFWPTKDLTDKK